MSSISWIGNNVLDSTRQKQTAPRTGAGPPKTQTETPKTLSIARSGAPSMMQPKTSPQPKTPSDMTQPTTPTTQPETPSMPPVTPMTQPTPPVTPAAPMAPMTPAPLGPDPTSGMAPTQEGPPSVLDRGYIPAYLTRNIGKIIRAEFLIGNNTYLDKSGKLVEVGISYFVIEDFITKALIMCDLYSVRFVTTL